MYVSMYMCVCVCVCKPFFVTRFLRNTWKDRTQIFVSAIFRPNLELKRFWRWSAHGNEGPPYNPFPKFYIFQSKHVQSWWNLVYFDKIISPTKLLNTEPPSPSVYKGPHTKVVRPHTKYIDMYIKLKVLTCRWQNWFLWQHLRPLVGTAPSSAKKNRQKFFLKSLVFSLLPCFSTLWNYLLWSI